MKKVAISLFQAMFETNFVVTVLFCHYMQMKKMLLFATTLLHSNLSEKNPVNSCNTWSCTYKMCTIQIQWNYLEWFFDIGLLKVFIIRFINQHQLHFQLPRYEILINFSRNVALYREVIKKILAKPSPESNVWGFKP